MLAPLTFSGAAYGQLAGGNVITCAGASSPITTSVQGDIFRVPAAGSTGGVTVTNCYATSTNNTVAFLLSGTNPGHTNGINEVTMTGNRTTGMGLFSSLGSTSDDITILGNSSYGAQFGVYLTGAVTYVRAVGNHFVGGGHGIELYGNTVAASFANLAAIMAVGDPAYFTITGNTCEGVGGACAWTSTSHDGVIANNVAHGCGDVCFDAEGSAYVTETTRSARTP